MDTSSIHRTGQAMAATFSELLQKSEVSKEEKFSQLVKFSRDKKYSCKNLIRIYEKLLNIKNADLLFSDKVSADGIVFRIVADWNMEKADRANVELPVGQTICSAEKIEETSTICSSEMFRVIKLLERKLDSMSDMIQSEREEARDRETRLLKRISFLENHVKDKNEQLDKIAEKLSVLNENLISLSSSTSGRVQHTLAQQPSDSKRAKPQAFKANGVELAASTKTKPKSTVAWADSAEPQLDHPTETMAAPQPLEQMTALSRPQPKPRPRSTKPIFPSFDSDDEDESWKLVCKSRPGSKRCVLYVGGVSEDVTSEGLVNFIQARAKSVGLNPPRIYNAKIFSSSQSVGSTNIKTVCGARITVDEKSRDALTAYSFWPRRIYARPWRFFDQTDRTTSVLHSNGAIDLNSNADSGQSSTCPKPCVPDTCNDVSSATAEDSNQCNDVRSSTADADESK